MVVLSRIYTKTGDGGETNLGTLSRVAKDNSRVAAYGDVDELNSVLGLLVAHCPNYTEMALIRTIQNDLFDVGADLCLPILPDEQPGKNLRITAAQAERLEKAIDRLNEPLQPLRSFILPGGSATAAWLHLARTVCRRAERGVVTLMRTEAINQQVLIYLNRLSDLFFVMARSANELGKGDVLWVPGKSRSDE
jgi:cob(I)alamin adenosyltransferase